MTLNFVSVSGISDEDQLLSIRQICLEERIDFPLAIGYQVSSMSINQGTQNPRQPLFAELPDLDKRTRDWGFITALHYYTRDNTTILHDLEKIIDSGINPKSLLQFNSLPPSVEILEKVKKMGFRVILKVAVANKSSPDGGYKVWKGDSVEDVTLGNPEPLVKQIFERKDWISYAMFDPSHGTNLELDLSESSLAVRFGKMVVANPELGNIGLIYAGGIKPNNVTQVSQQLRSFFPDRFSIDSEGGVRVDNQLNLKLVCEYLRGYNIA